MVASLVGPKKAQLGTENKVALKLLIIALKVALEMSTIKGHSGLRIALDIVPIRPLRSHT